MWLAIAVGCVGCFALKLVGYSLPRRVIEQPVVKHVAELLPVALLTALIATQTFTTGHHLQLDARAAGLVAAAIAVRFKAPFLVVVAVACVVTALVRVVAS
ncbi:MAG TPA: AzlD domain-containing protein [Acidothermaceae bacterium]|nr:AzlD domain-containing protein [Acidothermaceae bacterium]